MQKLTEQAYEAVERHTNKLKRHEEWIIVELNPDRDLLNGLAANLSSNDKYAQIFNQLFVSIAFDGK